MNLEFVSALSAKVIRKDGTVEDKGVVSDRVVTAAGVNYLVDSFVDSSASPMDNFKYHASGTATGAESTADTSLLGEVDTRETGSLGEGSSTNIFISSATHAYTSTLAITEHGILNSQTNGALWDRSKFNAINVVNGDSIEFTYSLTCTPGG